MNYLIGAGGHASVIEDIASKKKFILNGVFYDGDVNNQTKLAKVDTITNLPQYIENNSFMIAFGDIENRIKLVELMNKSNVNWFTLIDPTAIICNNVEIGEGTVVMPGAIINSNAKIGSHVIINSGAIIEHGCVIDDYTHISPGCVVCGNVKIGSGSWVGSNAVVKNALEIGSKVIIGAGSVVINNIDSNTVVVGNPAKKKGDNYEKNN